MSEHIVRTAEVPEPRNIATVHFDANGGWASYSDDYDGAPVTIVDDPLFDRSSPFVIPESEKDHIYVKGNRFFQRWYRPDGDITIIVINCAGPP